jgi:3-carboxy-cis,cis-muconate cycloisomerase
LTTPGEGPFLLLTSVFGDAEVDALFSEEATVDGWLEAERALAAAQAELGMIPSAAADAIAAAAVIERVDLEALRRSMHNVGYPIISLIDQIALDAPRLVADYVHWGATTQDIMDTGLVLQLGRGLALIAARTRGLGDVIAELAETHKLSVMAARTHGQQAVPTTFGLKLAVWLAELGRHLQRMRAARERAIVVEMFGAAGTAAAFGSYGSALRRLVAKRLEIGVSDVPWHSARDGVCEVGLALAALAMTTGKIAREVIELSRTEIAEVRESPAPRHGGSSTMPQKVNPALSEAVVGMSALARDRAPSLLTAMQGVHERSAGEWQIEWDALPGLFSLTAGCVRTVCLVLATLDVFPERMRANLQLDQGSIMAEAVMMALAPWTGRLQAHELVAESCRAAREHGEPLRSVLTHVLDAETLRALPPLERVLDPRNYVGAAEEMVTAAVRRWREVDAATSGWPPARSGDSPDGQGG